MFPTNTRRRIHRLRSAPARRTKAPLTFLIGTRAVTVEICPGPLLYDAEACDAAILGDVLYIAGDVEPNRRAWPLIDQLRRLHVAEFGTMTAEGVVTFALSVHQQLVAQGGIPALERLMPQGAR